MSTTEDEVDALLEDCNPRKPGMIEKNKPLAKAITHFMKLKFNEDERVEHVSLAWFYENKLRPKYNGPKKIETVKKFISEVLMLDPETGGSNLL